MVFKMKQIGNILMIFYLEILSWKSSWDNEGAAVPLFRRTRKSRSIGDPSKDPSRTVQGVFPCDIIDGP